MVIVDFLTRHIGHVLLCFISDNAELYRIMTENTEFSGQKPTEFPHPYNLEDFPLYKKQLLNEANEAQRSAIEQTFDPDNLKSLNILTDPEFSGDMSSDDHESEFNKLYPALDKVLIHHTQSVERNNQAELRNRAIEAGREAETKPGSYLSYWRELAYRAEEMGDMKAVAAYVENGIKLQEIQREVLAESADSSVASEWYLRIGALSEAKGAEEMMVYAASLPLAAEAGSKYRFSVAQQILFKGSMLSEASLINERFGDGKIATQSSYVTKANEWFNEIIRASRGRESDTDIARQAEVYISDLTMREAHRLALQAESSGGNDKLLHESQDLAARSILALQDVVLRTQRERDTGSNERVRSDARGELVERTILLLLREHASRGKLAEELPYQAFPRQDYPHDGMVHRGLPRQSFDIIQMRKVKTIKPGEFRYINLPIQVKNKRGEMVYVPKIVPLANFGDQVDVIIQSIPQPKMTRTARQNAALKFSEYSDAIHRKIESTYRERRLAR